MRLLIQQGRLIDPFHGIDTVTDLCIADGLVCHIGQTPEGFTPDQTVDATGQWVLPGFIDLCARLREPGQEYKATIISEARAAAATGITTLVCPPDTDPVIDEPSVVEWVHRRATAAGYSRVLVLGALTQQLKGTRLAEMAALQEAGCVGISDGGVPVADTRVLRHALDYAASFGLKVFLTPRDVRLSQGLAHAGPVATRLGLTGIPVAAEAAALARDLELVRETGAQVHFGRLSSARAAQLIRAAQTDGLPVTADVGIPHLYLTEMDMLGFGSQYYVQPPLRAQRDKETLRWAVAEGIIGAICSDHQPHELDAKRAPVGETQPGMSTIDVWPRLTLRLAEEGLLSLSEAVARLTCGPARILGLDSGHLGQGAVADVCVLDAQKDDVVTAEQLHSHGKHCPFIGWTVPGRITCTVVGGKIVYQA